MITFIGCVAIIAVCGLLLWGVNRVTDRLLAPDRRGQIQLSQSGESPRELPDGAEVVAVRWHRQGGAP